MELSSNVKLHVIMPDTSPFLLFGIEILTEYSRTIITKRYTDISRFQNNLCYFAHSSYSPGKTLMEILPTLPFPQPNLITLSDHAIAYRKKEVEKYFKCLCNLYNLHAFNQKFPWIMMIRKFLSLDDIELKQKKAASLIQSHFQIFKRYQCIRKKTHEIFLAKGYLGRLEGIPDEVLIYIFRYLDLKDIFRIASVSKRWNQITEQPIL